MFRFRKKKNTVPTLFLESEVVRTKNALIERYFELNDQKTNLEVEMSGIVKTLGRTPSRVQDPFMSSDEKVRYLYS